MTQITIYKNSVLATLVSLCGSLSILAGVALAFGGTFLGGIVMFLLGLALAALASMINERAKFRKWIRNLKENGILQQAKENAALAIKLFESNPTRQTLQYIRKLNPTAAGYIDHQLAAQKQ